MSSKAIANPEEMEQFAHNLKEFNGDLRDKISRLNAQFARLGETWQDQEHVKFAQEYQQTMRMLHRFMQTADEQVPLLRRKAGYLRDYLNHR